MITNGVVSAFPLILPTFTTNLLLTEFVDCLAGQILSYRKKQSVSCHVSKPLTAEKQGVRK